MAFTQQLCLDLSKQLPFSLPAQTDLATGVRQVMMNATLPPSKRSTIERRMDRVILFMFALLFAMCIAGAACFAVWTRVKPCPIS